MTEILNKIKWLSVFILLLVLSIMKTEAQVSGYDALREYAPLRISPAWGGFNTDASVGLLHKSINYGEGVHRSRSIVTAVLPWINKETKLVQGGGGLYFLNESPSQSIGFKTQEIGGSFAYTVRLNKNHDLALGLGGSWTSIQLSTDGLTTGSLWHPIYGFIPDAEINEIIHSERNSYLSVYSGLLWSSLDKYNRERHRLGVNIYRMNSPENRSDLSSDYLNLGYSITASITMWAHPSLSITPDMIFEYADNRQFIQGAVWGGYHFYNENPTDPISTGSLAAALSYSNNGSFGLGFKFDQKNYELAMFNYFGTRSNDISMPNQSSFEVAFKLKNVRGKRRRNKETYYKSTAVSDHSQNYKYRTFNEDREAIVTDADDIDQPSSNDFVEKEPKSGSVDKPIIYTLQYRLNETRLTRNSQLQLDYTVKLLMDNPDLSIKIIGHSDDLGMPKVKAKIAWERAKQIRDYFWTNGVEKHRVQATSKSDNVPLVDNDTDENRALNRRVELLIFER
ncbi:OmpA family protein [Flammeovirga pacifica]|nr:OmpA family protein [Flammeovirga pacifica]